MTEAAISKAEAKKLKSDQKALAKAVKEANAFNAQVDKLHDEWDSNVANLERQLEFFKTYNGEDSSEHIVLRKDERFIAGFAAGLIEERAGQAHYVGGNQGFSIPVGSIGGRSIRYHVGSSRGHIERGAPVETTIDVGKFIITNQRIVFAGGKQTRECAFNKLVSIEQPFNNRTVVSVTNRQKATIFSYDSENSELVHVAILLATALYQGTRDDLVTSWTQGLEELRSQEPKPVPVPTLEDIANEIFVAPAPNVGKNPKAPVSRFVRTAFVLSLVSLAIAFIPGLGLIFWIVPIVLSIIAAFRNKENRKLATGAAWISLAAAVIALVLTNVYFH
jgi:hypothetical protein